MIIMPTIEDAQKLLEENVKDEKIKLHCLEVSTIAKAVAKELNEDEEKWKIAGLTHDMDCEMEPDIHKQALKAADIMKKNGFSEDICHAILTHNKENLGVKRESTFDYGLSACDNISGLIYAYALMRNKEVTGMTASKLKKKLKNKDFAAAVRRNLIYDINKTGLELDKFLEIAIQAMVSIAPEIGLN